MLPRTVLQGVTKIGYPAVDAGDFEGPPVWKAINAAGAHLSVNFKYSIVLWPWSNYLELYITVLPEAVYPAVQRNKAAHVLQVTLKGHQYGKPPMPLAPI